MLVKVRLSRLVYLCRLSRRFLAYRNAGSMEDWKSLLLQMEGIHVAISLKSLIFDRIYVHSRTLYPLKEASNVKKLSPCGVETL